VQAEERPEPPETADEMATLSGYLDWQRATLEWKCSGLLDDDLRRRAVPTSNLSLLGLLRHLAEVERGWWARAAGESVAPRWCTKEAPDADFLGVDTADIEEAWAAWREECEHGRRALNGADLDARFTSGTYQSSVRWLAVHLIEEYARHNGHADLLREAIDGQTGE
jgi:uncharacterized damage-inducible protein DinB